MLKNNFLFPKLYIVCWLVFYILPLALLLWFVASFSVNIPHWDEWELVSLFDKVADRTATFQDFFSQHNEHRIVFPRIIFTILAFSTNWNISYNLVFSILLAVCTLLIATKISYSSYLNSEIGYRSGKYLHLANILSCILVFSLAQYENWLWGFQVAWFLTNFCVFTAIFSLTSLKNVKAKISVAAIFCFAASFSLGHGLLSWIALIPSVIAIPGSYRQKAKRIIFWLCLFVISTTIYFLGYQKPVYHPDLFFSLKQPFAALSYLLTLIGTPLFQDVNLSAILGLLVLASFLFFVIHYTKNQKTKFAFDATPWLSLGLFSLLFDLVTTLGRAGFGLEQALSSRYTSHSILLIIALVQMCALFLNHGLFKKNYKKTFIDKVFSFSFSLILVLIFFNSTRIIADSKGVYQQRNSGHECIELNNYINSTENNCLKKIYPDVTRLKMQLNIIDKLGFRKFPTDIDFAQTSQPAYGYIDVPATTDKPIKISKSQSPPVTVSGWSAIPELARIPKLVLFSYNGQKSFFATAYVNLDRPDVARALNSSRYSKVGWQVHLSPQSLPSQEMVLKAWVYDDYKNQFIQIQGEPRIKVVE